MRKSPVSYAPRGVAKKAIALRLLAPELARHESLASQNNISSAGFARQIYLRGLKVYERTTATGRAAGAINATAPVNQA